jgi:hypothetical protein
VSGLPDPNYPAGALEAVARRLVVDRYGKAMATAVLADDDLRIGRVALDALAAMSPEDRAALARWLTEGRDDTPLDDEDHSDDGIIDRRGDPDLSLCGRGLSMRGHGYVTCCRPHGHGGACV